MRLLFASILSLLVSFNFFGQNSYNLIVLEELYSPLETATVLSSEYYDSEFGWDDPEFTVPIGFTFSLAGNEFTSLDQIGVGAAMAGSETSDVSLLNGLLPIYFDLADRGIAGDDPSLIRYQTTGNTGERVFIIEWYNAGLYDEVFWSPDPTVSSLNFQICLYESDNSIEFRYGECNYPPQYEEPSIACLFLDLNVDSGVGDFLAVSGHPAFCTLESIDNYGGLVSSELYSLDYYLNAMVYRFEPMFIDGFIDINESNNSDNKLEKVVDALGREVNQPTNQILFHIYDDGSVEKKFVVE